jgi:hypothetical protein
MPNTYQLGRVGRVFAAKQSSFGTRRPLRRRTRSGTWA